MLATELNTAQASSLYRRLATAIGPEHWQGAVARQNEAIRSNRFLRGYLHSEYAIAYQLEKLRVLIASHGDVYWQVYNDQSIFPALAFAAQVLGVLDLCTKKQAATFVKRVKTAFRSSENMHGLCLELQAATHFTGRGKKVSWHRANNTGTFDLLVEDIGTQGLEIECKSISSDKGRRIHQLDALNFWGEAWKGISMIAQHLRSGMAVVLTVPYRLPTAHEQRETLVREVVTQIVAGTSANLSGGVHLRVQNFEPEIFKTENIVNRQAIRLAINEATGTFNRNAALCKTPAGGMLAFVMQSAVEDDVLEQVFATLTDSASRQFTGDRGALFWVALQGVDAEQMALLNKKDNDPDQQPSQLSRGVSKFFTHAPENIIGVVFCSRNHLYPTLDGSIQMGGLTNFFVNEGSPHWDDGYREPLVASSAIS